MKRLLVLCALAAIAAPRAFGIAASQAWVAAYVSNYVAGSAAEVLAGTKTEVDGGVVTITAGNGAVLTMEQALDAALVATNCTAAAEARGVTNGCLFVWNGAGAYIGPNGTVTATPTNLVFSGVSSAYTNGVERFAGWFDAYGALVQPSTSLAVTNGMEEVAQ